VVVSSSVHDRMSRWCRDNLPEPLRPRELVNVERLPRNSLGKLERHALAALIE
jgi:acyl-coenzyme A synthetase/AMP-(fatty) acid ligase